MNFATVSQLLLSLLLLNSVAAFGDDLIPLSESQRVVQDPKTKIVYYVESDLKHVSAISPDGKLLWCCEVIPPTMEKRVRIISFSLDKKDDVLLDVQTNPIGPTYGVISKITGKYTVLGSD